MHGMQLREHPVNYQICTPFRRQGGGAQAGCLLLSATHVGATFHDTMQEEWEEMGRTKLAKY
jgi:hypothetical protein